MISSLTSLAQYNLHTYKYWNAQNIYIGASGNTQAVGNSGYMRNHVLIPIRV